MPTKAIARKPKPRRPRVITSLPAARQYAVEGPIDPGAFLVKRLFSELLPGSFERPYAQNPWTYSANQAIALPISSLPFVIFKEQKTDRPEVQGRIAALRGVLPSLEKRLVESIAALERPRARMRAIRSLAPWLTAHELEAAATGVVQIQSGPWVDLFERVNPSMTRSQLWEATFVHLGDCGNCFWELLGTGPKGHAKVNEVPTEIWPRGKNGWAPKKDAGKVTSQWVRFKGQQNEQTWELWEILHFKYFNPYSDDFGLPPNEPVSDELEQYWRSGRWNTQYFKNGASPGGFVVIKNSELDEEQQKKYYDQFKERQVGSETKAHRIGLLIGGDIDFKESGANHRDMGFVAMRDKSRDAVLASHRVSKAAVGIVEDANRANMLAVMRQHWETNLLPKVHYAEDLMWSNLFTTERTQGSPIYGAFDLSNVEALREDLTAKLVSAEQMLRLGYTTNQINSRLGLNMPEVTWGDVGYRPVALVPLDEKGNSIDDLDDEKPDDEPPEEEDDDKEEEKEDEGDEGKEKQSKEAARGPALVVRASEFHTAEHWDFLIRGTFAPAERRFTGKYRRFLKTVRGVQLKIIEEANLEQVHVAEQLVFPGRAMKDELEKLTTGFYGELFRQAEKQMEKEIKAARKEGAAEGVVMQFVTNSLARVSRTVDTIRKNVRKVLSAALSDGLTREEIQDQIRGLFNLIDKGGRVRNIAINETSSTVNGARFITMERLGVEDNEWLTANDQVVRDTHREYGSAGERPVGFNWADVVGGGYTLEYPQDSRAPIEETAGCRCTLVPS